MADLSPEPNLPGTGASVSFRNPFEERDPAEVRRELLEDAGPPISREKAIRRMVEADKQRKPE